MTERVIVANRGEIAIRVMQACTALGHDVVGVYTPEDNQSLHVDFARKNSSLGGKGIWCVGDYASLDEILRCLPKLSKPRPLLEIRRLCGE